MSRYTRRNPDFRSPNFRSPVQSPPVITLEDPTQSGGETLIEGCILTRFARVEAGSGTAEISRATIYGHTAAGPVSANCTQVEDLGEDANGRRFRMRFTGTIELAKGYRLALPGDWKTLKTSIGQFPSGILPAALSLGDYPQGALLFGTEQAAVPTPPPMMPIATIIVTAFDTVEVAFDTGGSGDLTAVNAWPISSVSFGAAIATTLVGTSTVACQFAGALGAGDTLSCAAYSDQITTQNGWYPPPVFFTLP